MLFDDLGDESTQGQSGNRTVPDLTGTILRPSFYQLERSCGLARPISGREDILTTTEFFMSQTTDSAATAFDDRRSYSSEPAPFVERRQFSNSHEALSPNARELAIAIDEYKVRHRRRFITYEEMMSVIEELGYSKG